MSPSDDLTMARATRVPTRCRRRSGARAPIAARDADCAMRASGPEVALAARMRTNLASVIGCLLMSGLFGARAFADYHYVYKTSAFTSAATDRYARTNGDDTKGEDLNYAFAPDGVHEQAHSPATLLLFLPGHGSSAESYTEFMSEAVKRGYYVIGLAYRNGQSIQNMCGYWADCPSYLLEQNVEQNTYHGFYSSTETAQPAAFNSINYRLGAYLSFLKSKGIANGFNWEQFYNYSTGNVVWSKIVIAGHSEGGATATWITKNKNVLGGIVFEAPYTDWDNATSNGQPANAPGYTPCASAASCPYTDDGGVRDVNRFATYLHNDSTNWVNRLWITLNTYDKGYDSSTNVVSCDANNSGVCAGGACVGGQCTIAAWPGVNMRGAGEALGKSEQFMSVAPAALNGHKWWTSTAKPTGDCGGHGATAVNGCYPSWMPAYWDLVLDAVLP
jgi:hypothetical protein